MILKSTVLLVLRVKTFLDQSHYFYRDSRQKSINTGFWDGSLSWHSIFGWFKLNLTLTTQSIFLNYSLDKEPSTTVKNWPFLEDFVLMGLIDPDLRPCWCCLLLFGLLLYCPPWLIHVSTTIIKMKYKPEPTCRTCSGVAGCSCVVMLPGWSWWSRSGCCLWCSRSTDVAGRTRWMLWGTPENTQPVQPQTSPYHRDTENTENTHITEDGYVGDELQDGEPDANALSSLHHRAAIFTHKLLSIQTNLHPVINESEERSERTRRHEDGDETKLDYWERGGFTNSGSGSGEVRNSWTTLVDLPISKYSLKSPSQTSSW